MNIHQYAEFNDQTVRVSREQASTFAKGIAGDFNPIHDADAKKFCVPGDLLFAVVLHRYGVTQHMRFEFEGMVNDETKLILPDQGEDSFALEDAAGKRYMSVTMSGERRAPDAWVSSMAERYVAFSGKAFPHILVGLMQSKQVMINPSRPLVIYRNMSIELDSFADGEIDLKLKDADLELDGKKGMVTLSFVIESDGQEIGHGAKRMVLSGLREYDQAQMDEVIHNYDQSKQRYLDALS